MEIVECNENDLPELSILWEMMVKEIFPDASPKIDWWIDYTKSFMLHGDYKCFKAVINNIIIGFIDGMLIKDPSLGKIVAAGMSYFVIKKYRGMVGARLYLKLVKEGKKRGAEMVQLICYQNNISQWQTHNMHPHSITMAREI